MRVIILVALVLSISVRAATPSEKDVVVMPTFTVKESTGAFELAIHVDAKTQLVRDVVVSWVGAKAQQARMRVGDRLTAIDDKPVAGLSVDDVRGLKQRELKKDQVRKLLFIGPGSAGGYRKITWTSRGFGPPVVLKVEPTPPLAEKPNKALEPTPMSVTPPAAQESRRP